MRLAILADIHGNLPALEAVLGKLEELQPDYVLVNGDLINVAPFSNQVIERVRQLGWTVVRGNHEFYYLDYVCGRSPGDYSDPVRWGQLHWLVNHITPANGNYLAMLPDDLSVHLPGFQPFRMTHGVPGRNRVGFQPHHNDADIAAEIKDVGEHTLLSAHSHQQIDRHVPRPAVASESWIEPAPHDFCHVINPGSIGLPLNRDPKAQFAIMESTSESESAGGWKATFYRLDYDRRPALEAFTTSGMMAAGGVMSQLFYWQLVTADHEIIRFLRWSREHGHDSDANIRAAFAAYVSATARDQYVRQQDPLYQSNSCV
ncbi:MAG: metallophosphoesterase [Caldilineaceae bacterium]